MSKIEKNFKFHEPTGDKPKMYEDIRGSAKLIDQTCPENRKM